MAVELETLDDWTRSLVADMRAHDGRPTSGFFENKTILLLTTTGAKTGLKRSTIVTYHQDGDHWVIAASKGGADEHPQWYYNLKANPEATIEADNRLVRVRATEATGAERDRLWNDHVATHPEFGAYPSKTDRVIPMLVLEEIG